jgi:hypothetical protein
MGEGAETAALICDVTTAAAMWTDHARRRCGTSEEGWVEGVVGEDEGTDAGGVERVMKMRRGNEEEKLGRD